MISRIITFFSERGEGTKWDLDYGKLIIIDIGKSGVEGRVDIETIGEDK